MKKITRFIILALLAVAIPSLAHEEEILAGGPVSKVPAKQVSVDTSSWTRITITGNEPTAQLALDWVDTSSFLGTNIANASYNSTTKTWTVTSIDGYLLGTNVANATYTASNETWTITGHLLGTNIADSTYNSTTKTWTVNSIDGYLLGTNIANSTYNSTTLTWTVTSVDGYLPGTNIVGATYNASNFYWTVDAVEPEPTPYLFYAVATNRIAGLPQNTFYSASNFTVIIGSTGNIFDAETGTFTPSAGTNYLIGGSISCGSDGTVGDTYDYVVVFDDIYVNPFAAVTGRLNFIQSRLENFDHLSSVYVYFEKPLLTNDPRSSFYNLLYYEDSGGPGDGTSTVFREATIWAKEILP